ncbi:hypothetical protein PPTG_23423 [Phytophthora nicotianae INRA-310]|uniref:Uncharacterized protein n=1 Tax=Phytophthora nicotianae (strain INRA-310) TaxID=761204 RepID=W2Q0B8_PHYN3|nr:hypothetical protein PPTG_23423 [Phytophthora nicotianae INRA-310]ETN05740.1 hypothetical protein PPTG_23423 [Phytophthora nicotianae INRA-310]
MRADLVDYALVSWSLKERLDEALSGAKRTKRATAAVQIDLITDVRAAFQAVRNLLSNSAKLAYSHLFQQLDLLSDASDRGCGLGVLQVTIGSPIQNHEILLCMRESFTTSSFK